MINVALKLFIVEYSMQENTTSIRTLERVLLDNIRNVRNGVPKDYLPVGVFTSRAAADRFNEHFIPILASEAQLEFHSRNWRRIAECLEDALQRALEGTESEEK